MVVEAQAEVQRHAAHGPPILRVDAERRLQMLGVDERPRVLGDRRRDAAQERPRLRLVRVVAVVARAPHVGHADAERMAARHVVRGETHVVLMVRRRGEHVRGAVEDAERRLGLRDDGVGAEAVDVVRLGAEDPRLVVEGEAALEQQPVGRRVRPARLQQVLGLVREVHARFGRVRRAALVAVDEPLVEVAEEGDLVLLRRLPREVERLAARPRVAADRLLRQVLRVGHERRRMERVAVQTPCGARAVLRRARPQVGEHARNVALRPVVAEAAEEPELVLHDRPADDGVEVPQLLHAVHRLQVARDQILREVVALEARVREVAEEVAAVGVAAFFRDDVGQHAARARLGGEAARRHRHLLHRAGVDDERRVVAAARVVHVVERHPVHHERHLIGAAAVHRQRLVAIAAGAADVLRSERNRDAGDEDAQVLEAAAGRQRVDEIVREGLPLRDALRVDERALGRDGDGLLDGADAQIRVDRGREVGREHDAVALERVEARERERDGIGARREIDDLVVALAVARRRAHLLDQRGARGFHGDAGQHAAARVLDLAGNAAGLRERRAAARDDGRDRQRDAQPHQLRHLLPPRRKTLETYGPPAGGVKRTQRNPS